MALGSDTRLTLPLFPLPDVVHFPRTELRLHVFEPRYRRLVRDVAAAAGRTWIGMVLLRPGWEDDYEGRPPVYDAGTAGRLEDVEYLPDGRSNIVLRGEFRFEIEREFGERLYRLARVRPVREPDEALCDVDLAALRRRILATAGSLRAEMGERFPLADGSLAELTQTASTEEFVNRIAATLDVPPLRKLQLLSADLPQRAERVLSILHSRQRVLDLLRPFRHLAAGAETN